MDIQQMISALAVAKHKSFSEAAEQTSFSQSAISKQINSLEAELGVKLFDRRAQSSSITPTEIGNDILHRIEHIVGEYSNLSLMAKNYTANEQTPVSLGSCASLGSFGEDVLMAEFVLRYPRFNLYNVVGSTVWLSNLLQNTRLDSAIIGVGHMLWPEAYFLDFVDRNRCLAIPLLHSQTTVGLSARHPLANRQSIHLSELKDEIFFLQYKNKTVDGVFFPDRHENFITMCREAGFTPKFRSLDDYSKKVRLQIIAKGAGVMLNTSPVLIPYEDIRFIPIYPVRHPITSYFVALRENESPALKALTAVALDLSIQNGFTKADIF